MLARDFAADKIIPVAAEFDEKGTSETRCNIIARERFRDQ